LFSAAVSALSVLTVCSAARAYEPTSNYAVARIQGWKVMVNSKLLDKNSEHYEAGSKALEKFHDDLYTLTKVVPPARLKDIQTTVIWLEVDTTVNAKGKRYPCFHFHPSRGWLVANDYNPEKVKCVEIGKAATYARQGDRSVRIMLHELAHSYHNRFLGFDEKSIAKAYKAAKASGKYPDGHSMSNCMEYFASLTVRCFGREDRRRHAQKRDPDGFKLVAKLWGPAKHYLGDDAVKFKGDKRKIDIAASQRPDRPKFKPTKSYIVRNIQGWKVYVDPMLITDEKEVGKIALDEIDLQLRLVVRALPPAAVEKLRKCAIWLEGENDHHTPAACFHGSPSVLKRMGLNPDKAPGIELANAARLVRWSKQQPSVMLHELTHFYQYSVLRSDKAAMAKLRKGFELARASGKYDSVKRYHGRPRKHYAIRSLAEYFAESTEAYFGTNDYYPFVRAELKQFDPYAYKLMREIWGVKYREPLDYKRHNAMKVTAVPAGERTRLKLDPFYQKYCSARGFPVVASKNVSDYALKETAYLLNHMLLDRPDVRNALIDAKVRFVIIGVNEYLTDMPEYSSMRPRDYWDRRARGVGASSRRPAVSCGEENILCYKGDPYPTESIVIHEFAHAIHLMGLNRVDRTFRKRLDECYRKAMSSDLWVGKYAARNASEYWAEGVQSWFDNNRQNDHDHNHVNTRQELLKYDPGLALLVGREFRNSEWRYVYPKDREKPMHLKGYDPAKAPKFKWPKRLEAVHVEIMTKILKKRIAEVEAYEKKTGKRDDKSRAELKHLEERINKRRKELEAKDGPQKKAADKKPDTKHK